MPWSRQEVNVEIDVLPITPPGTPTSPITGPVTLTNLGLYSALIISYAWSGPAQALTYGGVNVASSYTTSTGQVLTLDSENLYLQAANWYTSTASIQGGGNGRSIYPLNGANTATITPFGGLVGFSYQVYGTTEFYQNLIHNQWPLASTNDTMMLDVVNYTISGSGSRWPIPCTSYPSRVYVENNSTSSGVITFRVQDTPDVSQLFFAQPPRGAYLGMEQYLSGVSGTSGGTISSTTDFQVNTSRSHMDFPNTLRPITISTDAASGDVANIYWVRSVQL